MKKTILVYGLLAAAVSVVMLTVTLIFSQQVGFDKGAIFGYATIILSLSMIFFGIKSYRDNAGGGAITFGRGLAIGLLITVISSVFYVIVWLIIYYNFMPDFFQQYGDHVLEKLKASGATPEAVSRKAEEMKELGEKMKNPVVHGAYVFLEPFPVGVVIALISALVLKRKSGKPALETAA